jgi:hypothetical protein
MDERVAGPGEMTCVDEKCGVSGLRQAAGGPNCSQCGGELARMPGMPSSATPTPMAIPAPGYAAAAVGPGGGSTWQRMSPGARLVVAFVVAALVVMVSFVIRNPDFLHRISGGGYAVGDCVRVRVAGLSGSEMDKADCTSDPAEQFSGDPVYRVARVEDGKDASCPVSGFGGVTFSNEPEDRTYCLVIP